MIRAGVDLKVSGLSFDLFVALMRAAPNVVTVRTLMDIVWTECSRQPRDYQPTCQTPEGRPRRQRQKPALHCWVSNRGYRIVATVTALGPGTWPIFYRRQHRKTRRRLCGLGGLLVLAVVRCFALTVLHPAGKARVGSREMACPGLPPRACVTHRCRVAVREPGGRLLEIMRTSLRGSPRVWCMLLPTIPRSP